MAMEREGQSPCFHYEVEDVKKNWVLAIVFSLAIAVLLYQSQSQLVETIIPVRVYSTMHS